jgi:serine/threonine-protein kinase
LIGRLLHQRYRVEELIARGGMASVYRGTDTRLGRTVALKVMAPVFAEDPDFVARFSREAQAAAGIYHGNVVIVHDQGEDDGVVYLVMEYVPGRTLRDLLAERGRLDPTQALDVLEPVLAALQAAHAVGLVHRDVKPENVLIGRDGRIKVTDFGLARAAATTPTSAASQGVLMGTMAYLAPEQTRGVADARSDVYSSGVLLFEMLTGQTPFQDDNALGLAYRHVHDVVPAPSSLVSGVPPSADRLVAEATKQDPDARPRDAGAMLALVEQARRGLLEPPPTDTPDLQQTLVVPIPTPPGPAGPDGDSGAVAVPVSGVVVDPGSGPPRRRRSRGWVALAVVVVLAVAAGAAAYWLGTGRYTTVPGVVGVAAKQAETKLAEQGLSWQYGKPGYSEIVPEGQVLSSDPEPGGRVTNGGTVVLVLSKGPERYQVPKLSGLTVGDAVDRLAKRTLVVGSTSKEFSTTVKEGRVITSSPKPGTEVRADAEIDLVVSRGLPPVTVPNVVGKAFGAAKSDLAVVGLEIRQTGERYQDGTTKGEVLSQTPAAEARVTKGSTVEVVVSLGPPLVEVPNVLRKSVDNAKKLLSEEGFRVVVDNKCVVFCVGVVVDQSPNGGELAPKGSTVTVTVV